MDNTRSVDWIAGNGGRVLNLLTKGSEHHCRVQLKKSVEEHLQDIARTVEYAVSKGLTVNVYLEDWSQGMQNSESYVMALTEGLTRLAGGPDLLGISKYGTKSRSGGWSRFAPHAPPENRLPQASCFSKPGHDAAVVRRLFWPAPPTRVAK